MLNKTDKMANIEGRLYLRPDAKAIVDEWEADGSKGRYRHEGLLSAIASWWMFAEELEGGYVATIDDYTNDLTARSLVQRVLDMVPEGSSNILEVVSEYDGRIKRATRAGGRSILAQVYRDPPDWWWWDRFPLKPSVEMRHWESEPPDR